MHIIHDHPRRPTPESKPQVIRNQVALFCFFPEEKEMASGTLPITSVSQNLNINTRGVA